MKNRRVSIFLGTMEGYWREFRLLKLAANFVALSVSLMSGRFGMIWSFSELDLDDPAYCNIAVVVPLSNGTSEVTYGRAAMIYFPFG